LTWRPTSWTEHRDPGMGKRGVYEYELAGCKRILISRFFSTSLDLDSLRVYVPAPGSQDRRCVRRCSLGVSLTA
jgi:hypothetical protein